MDECTGWWLDEYDGPRFWSYVDKAGGTAYETDRLARAQGQCWAWKGGKDSHGYGTFRLAGKSTLAHRVAYLDGGRANRIPDGWVIDHLCRNSACVNPRHLEPVEQATNVQRGARGRLAVTKCPAGHEYSPDNTLWHSRDGRPYRRCATCLKASKRRTYLRRKEAGVI